jgi:hypothetical protein
MRYGYWLVSRSGEPSETGAPAPALQELLQRLGYRWAASDRGYVEVLLVREDERWLGRGTTEAEAFDDLVRQVFPSHAAQHGLDLLLREGLSPGEGRSLPEGPGAASAAAVAATPAAPRAAQEAPTGRADAPPEEPEPTGATSSPAPPPPPPPRPIDRVALARDLQRLEALRDEVDDAEPDLARWAPQRIRWALLVWIARARAVAEGWDPVPPPIEAVVRDVARLLGRYAGTFWPGSVPAMQVAVSPARAFSAGLDDGDPTPPASWAEVADRADAALESLLEQGDEDGWVEDPVRRNPIRGNGSERLQAIEGLLDELLPRDDASPRSLPPEAVERLEAAAAELRWLRILDDGGPASAGDEYDDDDAPGHDGETPDDEIDPVRWGAAVGTLRRGLRGLGSRGETLRRILDPSQPSPASFASQVESRAQERRRLEIIRKRPPAAPPPSPLALWGWLREAFDGVSGPQLVQAVGDLGPAVLALGEDAVPNPDRRLRRRLRELHRLLDAQRHGDPAGGDVDAPNGGDGDEAPRTVVAGGRRSTPPVAGARPASGARPPGDRVPALARALRPALAGQRTLLVSNREEPGLVDRLEAWTGLEVTMVEATPRRLDAQVEAIGHGGYDLVLCVTGFADHATDGALSKACKNAGVRYVRVYKGRPHACLRALSRHVPGASEAPPDARVAPPAAT